MIFDLNDHAHYDKMLEVVEKTQTSRHAIMKDSESTYDECAGNNWLDQLTLRPIKETMQNCVNYYAETYSLGKLAITNSWMNRVGVGGAVRPHRHELSVVSAAFYPIADKGSCPLIFKSPIAPYRMNEFVIHENLYNAQTQEVPCEQGKLILFPSWLEHFTNDNTTENRITVSFNTRYSGI